MSDTPPENHKGGGIYAVSAFVIWGAFPLYFKAISTVPAYEVFAHRILWVALAMLPVILFFGRWKKLIAAFRDSGAKRQVFLATALLSVNWLIFIWAISSGYVLQSSLGYYINPLFNVLLGVLVLGETLRPQQKIALVLAAAGVGVMVMGLGIFPWISLSLAATFALYGLVRKQSPVDAITGLFAETLMMLPLAMVFLCLLWFASRINFPLHSVAGFNDVNLLLLIMASGVVTAFPLVLFTEAVRRLPLSVLGFFQYITPTGHFVLAVFVFDEPFTSWHLASFILIWLALAVYSTDAWRHRSRMAQAYTA